VSEIVPALFSALAKPTSAISGSIHLAVIEVAKHVQAPATLSAVLEHSHVRHPEQRLAVAEALTVVVQEWRGEVTNGYLPTIDATVTDLLTDGSPDVKTAAKLACDALSVRRPFVDTPDAPPVAAEASPPPARHVTFTGAAESCDSCASAPRPIIKNHARPRRLDVERCMPPKTREHAELLLRGLGEVVAEGRLDRFSSRRNLLLDSVLAGAALLPDYERWEFVVLSLLDSHKQLLFLVLHQLLRTFDFHPLLVVCACQTFTLAALVDRFRKLPRQQQCVALRFVVAAIDAGIDAELSADQRRYVLALAAGDPSARPAVEQHFAMLDNPVPALLRKLDDEAECDLELRMLARAPDAAPAIEPDLVRFVAGGSEWQRQTAAYIAGMFPPGTFPGLVAAVLALEGPEHERAASAVARLFDGDAFLEDVLAGVRGGCFGERGAASALEFLHAYVAQAPARRCARIVESVVAAVEGILGSEVVPLRRLVLVIFVEFNLKIPEEFAVHLIRIPTNYQRMVELYCSRKKK
jgi:hypothetical protein